ncbi:hypothetical protein BDV97DRAFT_341256 [Delphinella strobiligena]|nr:hypothetical protein BDV97DRAFT_341256 [Delphinella strobiligena]
MTSRRDRTVSRSAASRTSRRASTNSCQRSRNDGGRRRADFSSLGEFENRRKSAAVEAYPSLCVVSGHAIFVIVTMVFRELDWIVTSGRKDDSAISCSFDHETVSECRAEYVVGDTSLYCTFAPGSRERQASSKVLRGAMPVILPKLRTATAIPPDTAPSG